MTIYLSRLADEMPGEPPVITAPQESIKIIRESPPAALQVLDLEELEQFYASVELPPGPVMLTPHERITDLAYFINASLTALKANEGKKAYFPYSLRLDKLRTLLQ